MERYKIKKSIEFLEDKRFFVICLATVIFVVYKILIYCVFNNLCPYRPNFNIILFISGFAIFILSYKISFKLKGSRRAILFFLITILIQLSIYSLLQGDWYAYPDSKGYYNVARLGAEESPIYLLRNYHALVKWDTDLKEGEIPEEMKRFDIYIWVVNKRDVEDRLKKFGIYDWAGDKMGWEKGLGKVEYLNRPALHPPLWVIILSFFISIFGDNNYSGLIAVWSLTALVPVALYYWLRRFGNSKMAIQATYLFILIPIFTDNANHLLMDAPIALLVITSSYFYLSSLERGDLKIASLSGILFSLCTLTKFMTFFLYLPFLALALIGGEYRKGIKVYFVFTISSLVLPFLLTFFGYYFFLNMITALSEQESFKMRAIDQPLTKYFLLHFPKGLVNFGIPVIFLLALGTVNTFYSKIGWKDKINLIFISTFLIAGFMFPAAVLRHIFLFFPLVMGMILRELSLLKVGNGFIYFILIIEILQKFILMLPGL